MKSLDNAEWRRRAALVFALILTVLILSAIPFVNDTERRVGDSYFRLMKTSSSSAPVIVMIDDESLRLYGRWPWPRDRMAKLVGELSRLNAKVIGLDILFAEPQSEDSDRQLEAAIRDSGRTVLVDKIGMSPDGPRWNEPLERFSRAASGVGHAQAVLDRDGVCRQFPPYELTLDGPRWAFAIEVARRTDPVKTANVLRQQGIDPSEDDLNLTIAKPLLLPIFFGRPNFSVVSAADVMGGRMVPQLKGRPVLVGFGNTELEDRVITPVSGRIPSPGVMVHAQIVENILGRQILRTISGTVSVLALLVVSGLAMLLCRIWRNWTTLAVASAALIVAYFVGFFCLLRGWSVPIGQWLLVLLIAPLMSYVSDAVAVEREVTHQLRNLLAWMNEVTPNEARPGKRIGWQLETLARLQKRLGSLYELHETLLRSSQDGIAVFDEQGRLLLHNDELQSILLRRLSARARLSEVLSETGIDPGCLEGEVEIGQSLYSYRIVPLPPTTLSPGGGQVLQLASLRMRQERDRARTEALGFVTHELRTPLVAIQGFSELMMRYPNSPAYSSAPQTIFNESRRLLALINSYLDVLRVDAGARPIAQDNVRLDEVVAQTIAILEPLTTAAKVKIAFSANEQVMSMTADKNLINGAVLNLVSNAVKHAAEGTEVSISAIRTGSEVILTVHNYGEKIAPEDLARVFDTYYRGSNVSAIQTGWGLGLAFVKRIVEKHGGVIRVESDETSGTTFRMVIPQANVQSLKVGGSA